MGDDRQMYYDFEARLARQQEYVLAGMAWQVRLASKQSSRVAGQATP